MSIQNTLSAVGTADVVVVLKRDTKSKNRTALKKHFTQPELEGLHLLSTGVHEMGFTGSRKSARSFADVHDSVIELPNLGMMIGTVDREGLRALRKSSTVTQVVEAPAMRLIRPTREGGSGTAPPAAQTPNWGLDVLELPALWAQGLTGSEVRIGHLDTGVDRAHPDLAPAVASWLETDRAARPVPGSTPYDDDGHGTHTAGTLAARRASGQPRIAAAPGAQLYSAKCIERGDLTRRVLVSIDWALGNNVRIISMSLGIPNYDAGWLAIASQLRALGVLWICAIGNEGVNTSRSPGNYANVLSVGMTTPQNVVEPDSSSMQFQNPSRIVPKIVAPGADIASTYLGGGYEFLTGTSMATPLVAGLAALLWEAKPTATADQIEAAVVGSCVLPAAVPAARGGAGVPNGPRALALL